MEQVQLISAAWLAAGGFGFLGLLWAARHRRPARDAPGPVPGAPDAVMRRVELRMEAIEGLQSALAARIEEMGPDDASERRLQGMAAQILGLVRDKNAVLDTALAGLEQMRARLRTLEQIGAPAEAREMVERLGARLDAVELGQSGARAALEARLTAVEAAVPPYAEISEQLTRLYAQKDATVETVFARLGPLEAKLGAVEGALAAGDPAAALARFAERLEAARDAQAAICDRLAALETGENPYSEISEQLTRLYAQKDATVETVFARLGPLEAKLGAVEGALAAGDPAAALERLAGRLEAARETQAAATEGLGARVEALQGRLAEIERIGADGGAAQARAEAQAIAAQLIAARTVAEETRLFANRISLLEASLPRLSLAQAAMLQAIERQAVRPAPLRQPAGDEAGAPEAALQILPQAAAPAETEEEALWRLPRVVSVHKT